MSVLGNLICIQAFFGTFKYLPSSDIKIQLLSIREAMATTTQMLHAILQATPSPERVEEFLTLQKEVKDSQQTAEKLARECSKGGSIPNFYTNWLFDGVKMGAMNICHDKHTGGKNIVPQNIIQPLQSEPDRCVALPVV